MVWGRKTWEKPRLGCGRKGGCVSLLWFGHLRKDCVSRQVFLSLLALQAFSNSNPESHACLGAGEMGQQLTENAALKMT